MAVAAAGRQRLWRAGYRWHTPDGWQLEAEPAIQEWAQLLAETEKGALFAGEISETAAKQIRKRRKWRLADPAANVRRAAYLAELGWRRLRKGQVDDARQLSPLYLRTP